MNQTLRKFGYPQTLLDEHVHWVVLLRPAQVTLGSLVLACKDEARAFAEVSDAAMAELAAPVRRVEAALRETFAYDKINYLMLMMVDPDVHFHVIPRYEKAVRFRGSEYPDPSWPGPPDLRRSLDLGEEAFRELFAKLEAAFRLRLCE